jgi:hypothetical protein
MLMGRNNTKGVYQDFVFIGQHGEQKDKEVIDEVLGSKQKVTAQAAASDQISIAGQNKSWVAHASKKSNLYAKTESQ